MERRAGRPAQRKFPITDEQGRGCGRPELPLHLGGAPLIESLLTCQIRKAPLRESLLTFRHETIGGLAHAPVNGAVNGGCLTLCRSLLDGGRFSPVNGTVNGAVNGGSFRTRLTRATPTLPRRSPCHQGAAQKAVVEEELSVLVRTAPCRAAHELIRPCIECPTQRLLPQRCPQRRGVSRRPQRRGATRRCPQRRGASRRPQRRGASRRPQRRGASRRCPQRRGATRRVHNVR